MVTFDDLMKGFGVVTVMNACIFVPKKGYTGERNCATPLYEDGTKTTGNSGGLTPGEFVSAYEYIDTLKIANFTQEGPTKTVTGGQYANPLIKYGKTMTAEIQDALGRASTMVRFFGCDYDGLYTFNATEGQTEFAIPGLTADTTGVVVRKNGTKLEAGEESPDYTIAEGKITLTAAAADDDYIVVTKPGTRLSVTDKFPGPFAIEGDTFFIDQRTGEKKHVYIFIPQFLPEAILTLTQDAEGDATVFDLNGSVAVTDIQDNDTDPVRSVFIEVREKSFFAEQRASMDI